MLPICLFSSASNQIYLRKPSSMPMENKYKTLIKTIRGVIMILSLLLTNTIFSQISNECKLSIGTNIAGVTFWNTDLQFVDLMKKCQKWHSISIGDPNQPWNSGFAGELNYRPDGYPTHIPQNINQSPYPQKVGTIWTGMTNWPTGQYVVLYDGTGQLSFNGDIDSSNEVYPGKIELNISTITQNSYLELRIDSSDINDPIHNIRVLLPGTENTYLTEPFYSPWLEKLDAFKTLRFMDWGHTNNWGQVNEYTIGTNIFVNWIDRSMPDYYTYDNFKGVPYESMVQLMNITNKDGWICVPHTASEDYIRNMAIYFRDNLNSELHLYVEFSNEIWNWGFGQTQWLNQYGCVATNTNWPEGIVPYIQNCMDYWTDEFSGQLSRITRVVGVQTGWLDVAQRVVNNMTPNSFDAIAGTYYFKFSQSGESQLDNLGANATISDIAFYARENRTNELQLINGIKTLADSLNKRFVFYEGGQHLTPDPFGVQPSYFQALLDIQRDTAMYNLYNEWYDMIRNFQEGNNPLLLMNYAFVGERSAKYGSWGILEYATQDVSQIPAPKYISTLENMNTGCEVLNVDQQNAPSTFTIYPNPTADYLFINSNEKITNVYIYSILGQLVLQTPFINKQPINISSLTQGIYLVNIEYENGKTSAHKIVIKK